MNKYTFETDQIGISEKGIHLLRSRFNYKTLEFSTIDEIHIEKGKQINNWFLILIIGISLLGLGLFMAAKVIYEFFFAENFHLFHVEQFMLPIIPILLGGYCIFSSIKSGFILKIVMNKTIKKIPIEDLTKNNEIDELKKYLRKYTTVKCDVFKNNIF